MILVALGGALLLVAYGMLYPGLTEPMLSLTGTVEKTRLVDIGRQILFDDESTPGLVRALADRFIDGLDTSGTVQAFDKTNSILGTAAELWNGDNALVAVLIVSFSVVVPAAKALLLLASCLPLAPRARAVLTALADASGKWSMADVFVIAILIAFLAGKGLSTRGGLVDIEAHLDTGFWWFLGYCLVSILGTQLLALGRSRLAVRSPARSP